MATIYAKQQRINQHSIRRDGVTTYPTGTEQLQTEDPFKLSFNPGQSDEL